MISFSFSSKVVFIETCTFLSLHSADIRSFFWF